MLNCFLLEKFSNFLRHFDVFLSDIVRQECDFSRSEQLMNVAAHKLLLTARDILPGLHGRRDIHGQRSGIYHFCKGPAIISLGMWLNTWFLDVGWLLDGRLLRVILTGILAHGRILRRARFQKDFGLQHSNWTYLSEVEFVFRL